MRTFLRFNAVSAAGVGVQMGVLALAIHVLRMHYLAATLLAVEAAVLHNFFWHWRWSWAHRCGKPGFTLQRSLWRFHLGNGIVSLVGNAALMWVFTGLLRIPPLIANLMAIAACYALNWLLADRFAFAAVARAGLCLLVAAAAPGQDLSRDKEALLGARMAERILSESVVEDRPEVKNLVERIGRKLAAAMPDSGVQWRFEVLRFSTSFRGDGIIEPIALPDGTIMISVKMIRSAWDEAELAGLIAHAMAHVEKRHGVKLASPGTGISLIVFNGTTGMLPKNLAVNWQAFEEEADQRAAEIAARAGYDPEGLARYLSRTQPRNR
jgi:putative flippase GtrA